MLSLQKTINYRGDLKYAPVKNITLEFHIPVYQYFNVAATTGEVVDRKRVNTETIVVGKAINSKEYQLVLSERVSHRPRPPC